MSALISVYYKISTLRADYLRGKKENHTSVSDPLCNYLERDKERGKNYKNIELKKDVSGVKADKTEVSYAETERVRETWKIIVIVISLPNPFQNKCQSNENKKRLACLCAE